MPSHKKSMMRTLLWWALLAVGLVFYVFPSLVMLVRLPTGDEAALLVQSRWVSQGLWPYHAFFEFIWPGSHFLGGALFALFGPSIVVVRLVVLGLFLGTIWAVCQIGNPYLKSRSGFSWLILILVMFLWGVGVHNTVYFSHHALSSVCAVWSVYGMTQFLRRGEPRKLALTGVFSALTLLFTQSLGAIMTLGLLGVLFYKTLVVRDTPFRVWGYYLLPFTMVLALCFGTLCVLGVGDDFWYNGIVWLWEGHYSRHTVFSYFSTGWKDIIYTGFQVLGSEGSSEQGIQLSQLQPKWHLLPFSFQTLCIGWLPVLGVLWGIWRALNPTVRTGDPAFVTLVLAAFLMLLSTLSYSSTVHITFNGYLGFLLGVLTLHDLIGRYLPRWKTLCVVLIMAFLLYLPGYRVWVVLKALKNPQQWVTSYGTVEPRFLALDGGDLQAKEVSLVTEMIRRIVPQTQPVFVLNASPEYYLLSDRSAAAGFLWIFPELFTDRQAQKLLQELEQSAPSLIVYDGLYNRLRQYEPERFKTSQYHHLSESPLASLADWMALRYTPMPLGGHSSIVLLVRRDIETLKTTPISGGKR